jgi:hypothetical protein
MTLRRANEGYVPTRISEFVSLGSRGGVTPYVVVAEGLTKVLPSQSS